MRTLVVPRSEVIFYTEDDTVPVREWLKALPNKTHKKCLRYIAELEMQAHELRGVADFLRDGIYIHHRILYFFETDPYKAHTYLPGKPR